MASAATAPSHTYTQVFIYLFIYLLPVLDSHKQQLPEKKKAMTGGAFVMKIFFFYTSVSQLSVSPFFLIFFNTDRRKSSNPKQIEHAARQIRSTRQLVMPAHAGLWSEIAVATVSSSLTTMLGGKPQENT